MNVTFCIMTVYEDVPRLNAVIGSIKALAIPNVEILIMGSYQHDWGHVDRKSVV